MTSNERKIIKYLREAKGEARIQLIARQTGFSQDYTRLLGRSLELAGYIKFADINLCHLLAKGRACFQDVAIGVSYPFQKNEEASEKSAVLEEGGESSPPRSFDGVSRPEELEENAKKEISIQNSEEPNSESPVVEEEVISGIEPQVAAELKQKDLEVEPIAALNVELSQESTEEKTADGMMPAAALNALNGASEKEKEKLVEAGYKSVEEVAEAPISKLIQSLGVSLKKAASWINQARRETGVIKDQREEIKK